MSAPARDRVAQLAKQDPSKALKAASKIDDPWYRTQALCWIARYTPESPEKITQQACREAAACQPYQRTAVLAWVVAALAEREHASAAKKVLTAALADAANITPASSRAEALLLLLEAVVRLREQDAQGVYQALTTTCGDDPHWRCRRAIATAKRILDQEQPPRPFFW